MKFLVYYTDNAFEGTQIKEFSVGTSIHDVLRELNFDPDKVTVQCDGGGLDFQPSENDVVSLNTVPEEPATVVVTVIISAVVGYAAAKLLMPDMGDLTGNDDATESYRISGAKNEAKPYEPVPIVLGKYKVTPPYAAAPYTEWRGDDEWFCMLVTFGAAPLHIENIRIGDTPITEYEYEMEYLEWYLKTDPEGVRRIWPDDIAQEVVDVDLLHPIEQQDKGTYTNADKSFEINPDLGWVTRTSSGSADQVEINVIAPRGAFSGEDNRMACFQYQYQDNDSDWVTVVRLFRDVDHASQDFWPSIFGVVRNNDNGRFYVVGRGRDYTTKTRLDDAGVIDITNYIVSQDHQGNDTFLHIKGYMGAIASGYVSANNTKQLKRSIRHATPNDSSPINLRLRKVFPIETPTDSQKIDKLQWSSIRTFRSLTSDEWYDRFVYCKTPKRYEGIDYYPFRPTLLALKVKATGQLSGGIDDLNADVTSVAPIHLSDDFRRWTDYVGISGELNPVDSPAYMYKWLLQGPAQENPIPPSRIDVDALYEWHVRCGVDGWRVSALVDYDSTLLKELNRVASTGLAEFGYEAGKYSIVEKKAKTFPVQMFTPKNSWDFGSERVYPEQVDGVRFEFENAEQDFQKDEGEFYDPLVYNPSQGIDKRTGKFEGLNIWGVSDPNLAYRHARMHYYEKMLRREVYTFTTDLEGLVASRGDYVKIQNDVISVGYGSGRVVAREGNTFALDESINLTVGTTYGVEFRTPTAYNGQYFHLITAVYNSDGTFSGSIPSYINVGDMAVYGEVGNETLDALVKEIKYGEDLTCNIVCVNLANEMYERDDDFIPEFQSSISGKLEWKKPPAPSIAGSSLNIQDMTINVGVTASTSDQSVSMVVLEYRTYPINSTVDEQYSSSTEGWERLYQSSGDGVYAFTVNNPSRGNIYQFRARVVDSNGIYSPLSDVNEFVFESDPADKPLLISLIELIDTPPTPDARFSTVVVEIEHPDDPEYSSSIIEYKKFDASTWIEAGFITPDDTTLEQQLVSDGSDYEFRARSLSVFNEYSTSAIYTAIALTNTLDPDYSDGLPDTSITIPVVTGLELFGKGNDTEFTGKDAKFSWRKSTVEDWLELGAEGAKGASGSKIDQFFKDYIVQIIVNDEVVRQEEVVDNTFTYTYEMNANDYKEVNGEKGAWRDFTIKVWERSRTGQISPQEASLGVENPAPELPDNLIADAGLKSIIVSWDGEPSDTDFEGILVWLSTTNTSQENLVYRGKDNILNLQGVVLRDEFGNPTLEITAGTEYRVDIAPYDAFGYVGVAPVATYNVTTETLTDRDTNKSKPCPPDNVVVTENTVVKSLTPTISVNVTWDASVGVWDETGLTCDVNADPGIITGYYVQWYATGGEVSERFTSSLTEQISNLDPATDYNFKVKAIDWAGNESPWSSVITLTLQGDSTPPDDASDVTLTSGLDKIIASWTNPADADWQATRVYLGTTSTFTAGASNLKYEGRSDTTVLADVTNGVNYYVRLQTVDTSGNLSGISAAYGPVQPFKLSSANIDNFMSDNAVVNVKIANAAVDSSKLSNLSVTASKLSGSSVTSTKIANAAVGNAAIANLAVSNAKIQNAAVTNAKIGNAAISTAKIQDAAITNAKIGTLDAGKITTGTLDADRIGANTIDANKINVTNLSAISGDFGTITAGLITGDGLGNGVTFQTDSTNPRVRISPSGGIEAYNSVGTRTFNVKTDGAVTIGTGADAITITTSGTVTVPGSIIADDIVGNTIRTATSGSRVEMGPNINGNTGRILRVLSGSTETFSVDTSGNVSMIGSLTMTGGSVDGNVTFDGTAATTVKDGAVKANAGLNASGDIQRTIGAALPNTNPSTSGLYMNSNYLGFYNGDWSNYFRSNGDALIGNFGTGDYVFWDQSLSTLTVRGTLNADDINTGTLNANNVNVTNINADNITAGTITGRTLQTASSGERVVVDGSSNSLQFYSGTETSPIIQISTTSYSTAYGIFTYPMGVISTAADRGGIYLDTDGPSIFAESNSEGLLSVSNGGAAATLTTKNRFSGDYAHFMLLEAQASPFWSVTVGHKAGYRTLSINGSDSIFSSNSHLYHSGLNQDDVGSLVFAMRYAGTGDDDNYGDLRSGSDLRPAAANGSRSGTVTLGGTYKCLGYTTDLSVSSRTTLWVKIA